MNKYVLELGKNAKNASLELQRASLIDRNNIITEIMTGLTHSRTKIITENKKDLVQGEVKGLSSALIDRLKLNDERIDGMIAGLRKIINFEDPLSEWLGGWRHENNMQISKVSVPIGVIGMIYESRPNVTVDVAGLAIKSGNCVILRGGSEAINSNKVLTDIIRDALLRSGYDANCIQLIEKTNRELVTDLIRMNDYIDVLIPRGGRGLKKAIITGATVPVIETGEGLCHIYIDEHASIDMAIDIVMNAKTQRTGVCNAMETLLIHENIQSVILPVLNKLMLEKNFEIRACEKSAPFMNNSIPATYEDWSTEYLGPILAIKSVNGLDEAIRHINQYGSGHSEAIVSDHLNNTEIFLNQVDASVVYVNASTRFTDGEVFGFGGEVGISTQKLHARGPMGIKALTTYKYLVRGSGQIRN